MFGFIKNMLIGLSFGGSLASDSIKCVPLNLDQYLSI